MIRPLHDRVLVRPAPAETETADGIILPDIAQENPMRGEVIAAGAGKVTDDSLFPSAMSVHVGDTVIYGKFSGVAIDIDGEQLLMMRESDIFGVVENDD